MTAIFISFLSKDSRLWKHSASLRKWQKWFHLLFPAFCIKLWHFWNLTTCVSHKGCVVGLSSRKLRIGYCRIPGHFVFLPVHNRPKSEPAADTISEGSGRESQKQLVSSAAEQDVLSPALLALCFTGDFLDFYSPFRLSPIDTEKRNLPGHNLNLNLPCLHKGI